MAKAKVVHSDDAVAVIFEGNPKRPEPTMGVIRFPGGFVEVSRCSDGSYWAHLKLDNGNLSSPEYEIADSRVDYDYEGQVEKGNGILDVPDAEHVVKLAMRIRRRKP